MEGKTTILIDKRIIELLKQSKEHPRQTYNELLEKMVRMFIKMKQNNQYDEFLHRIQQKKMRELWDNKEDEIWEKL